MSMKLAIMRNEVLRSIRRSISEASKKRSLQKIRQKFLSNGYPEDLIERQIILSQKNTFPSKSDKKCIAYIKCPYVNEVHRRKVYAKLRQLDLLGTIKVWFDYGTPLSRLMKPANEKLNCHANCDTCKMACRPKSCYLKNVIYQINCNLCSQTYIGETSRTVKSRIREHTRKSSTNSPVSNHIYRYHNQTEPCISWKILHRPVPNAAQRKSIEAYYINQIPSSDLMNGCEGKDCFLKFWILFQRSLL